MLFSLSVPRPSVEVSAVETVLVSGTNLSLLCSIMPPNVDTSIILQSNWTTPVMSHDRVNADNDATPTLNISGVETADSGIYSCTARAIDANGSQYILGSRIHTDMVDVTVSKSLVVTMTCHVCY